MSKKTILSDKKALALVQAFEQSGMSKRAFASSHGMSDGVFTRLQKRCNSMLLPVHLIEPQLAHEPFKVVLKNGVMVLVPNDFDAQSLARLVEVLSC